jgi:hypothetical protein
MSHVIGLKAVIVAFLLLYYTFFFPKHENTRIAIVRVKYWIKSLPLRPHTPNREKSKFRIPAKLSRQN